MFHSGFQIFQTYFASLLCLPSINNANFSISTAFEFIIHNLDLVLIEDLEIEFVFAMLKTIFKIKN